MSNNLCFSELWIFSTHHLCNGRLKINRDYSKFTQSSHSKNSNGRTLYKWILQLQNLGLPGDYCKVESLLLSLTERKIWWIKRTFGHCSMHNEGNLIISLISCSLKELLKMSCHKFLHLCISNENSSLIKGKETRHIFL